MKKILYPLVFCFLSFNFLNAQQLSALYDRCSFFLPSEGRPYLETYLLFDASTLQFVRNEKNTFNAYIDITLNLKRNDTTEYYNKYELKSPEISSLENIGFTFFDIQRFFIKNGIYHLDITIKDRNASGKEYTFTDKISVYYPADQISFSDVELVSEFRPAGEKNILSKSGSNIVPFVGNFLPKELDRLSYYFEIYGLPDALPEKTHYVAYTYVEDAETGFKIEPLQKMKREKIDDVSPIAGAFDIRQLPSGNYNLAVEVRNSENQTIAYHKHFLQRSNPNVERAVDSIYASGYHFANQIQDNSLLYRYIQALDVIASPAEQDFIREEVQNADIKELQEFFYRFWFNRDHLSPESEWLKFKQLYDAVEKNFSTKKRAGYKTDRGRVYLKYGPPNLIIDEKFKTAIITTLDEFGRPVKRQVAYLPYQIWRYDVIENNDPKRSFVFWSQQSAALNYDLLHSNAIGEANDPFWERRLTRYELEENIVGEAGRQFERGY